jgi:hypothetical protein
MDIVAFFVSGLLLRADAAMRIRSVATERRHVAVVAA